MRHRVTLTRARERQSASSEHRSRRILTRSWRAQSIDFTSRRRTNVVRVTPRRERGAERHRAFSSRQRHRATRANVVANVVVGVRSALVLHQLSL